MDLKTLYIKLLLCLIFEICQNENTNEMSSLGKRNFFFYFDLSIYINF